MKTPVLNSLTYNIAVETSSYTCQRHRITREAERLLASQRRKSMGTSRRLLRNKLTRDNDAKTSIDTRATQTQKDIYKFECSEDQLSVIGSNQANLVLVIYLLRSFIVTTC